LRNTGLNDISDVQRSLPNPRYEEFSDLRGVLNGECIYNQRESPLDMEGRNIAKLQMNSHLAKLQVSRKEMKGPS